MGRHRSFQKNSGSNSVTVDGWESCSRTEPFSYVLYDHKPFRGVLVPDNARFIKHCESTIDDVVGKRGKKKSFNDCLHLINRYEAVGPDMCSSDIVTQVVRDGAGRVFTYSSYINSFPIRGLAVDHALKRHARQFSNYTMRRIEPSTGALNLAYRKMLPQSGDPVGNMGLLVFVAELRDFKWFLHALKHPASILASFKRYKITNLKEMRKAILLLGAEGRLALKYAIEPFIADCKSLWNTILYLDDWLDKWNRDAGRRVLYARHIDIPGVVPILHPSLGSVEDDKYHVWSSGAEQFYKARTYCSYRVDARAHLWYYPRAIPMTKISKFMHYYDALGLGHAGSNIWNMLPFSFLVDYITNASDIMATFDKNMTEMPISVEGMGWSVKQTLTTTSELSAFGKAGASCRNSTIMYDRRRCAPPPGSEPGGAGWVPPDQIRPTLPSLGQGWNTVALLYAMLHKR